MIKSTNKRIKKLVCIILKVENFFFAISLEIVVGIPSWAIFNNKDKVGNVRE